MLFEDRLAPTGQDDAVDRGIRGEVGGLRAHILLDDGQGFDDRLKAILAPKGEMLEDPGQHLPVVVDILLAHDRLIPDAVLGPTGLGFRREIPKGLFLDLREEHGPNRAVGLFHHRLRDPVEQLDFPGHPLDILEQCLLEVLLGLGLDAPNHVQGHTDRVIDHVHGMDVHKAG